MTNGDKARIGEVAAYLEEMCAQLTALAREYGLKDAARYLHASERVAALEARRSKQVTVKAQPPIGVAQSHARSR